MPSNRPTDQTDMPAWVPGAPVTEPVMKPVDDSTVDAQDALRSMADRTEIFPAPAATTEPAAKSSPFKDPEPVGAASQAAPQASQASYPPPGGPGQPYPGQPQPGQPYPSQPQPQPGQPYPGQQRPGQPQPGQPGSWPGGQQPHPGTYPGQPGGHQHGVPPHGFPPGGVPPGGVPGPPSGGGGNTGKIVLIVLSVLAVLGLAGLGGVFLLRDGDGSDDIATGPDESAPADGQDPVESTDSTDVTPPEDEEPVDSGPVGAEQLARSVVQVQLLLDGQPVCTGSGTVIDAQGTIVTNFHVVEQSPLCPHDQIGIAVAASSSDIPVLSYEADLLAFDAPLDLAVIRIERTIAGAPTNDVFEPVEIGDSESVELGDELRVLGYPGIGGETVTFTTGTVSGFAETPEGGSRSWLKTDATIAGGNSGGLAVDSDGLFVGIPTLAGSGSGQIVDCRIIADSNGDGRLSEEDSCVPIGGFINGIRPVSLALPLIDDAATASPIDQGPPPRDEPMSSTLTFATNAIWTTAVENDQPVDDLAAAEIGGERLCIVWDFEELPAGAQLESRWFVDGEEFSDLTDQSVHNGGPQGRMFNCITAGEGLLAGVHEFAWLVDGEPVFAEAIHVGDGTAFVIEVFNDSPVPLCVVQFNPSATLSYGLNEADSTIEPGERREFLVGSGLIDARIIDCNGDIRLEDTTGYDHNSDISLTIE